MSSSYILQIGIEVSLAIMCLSIWICTFVQSKNYGFNGFSRYMRMMLFLVIWVLVFDIAAICYRGSTTTLGYFMVRISNLAVFLIVRSLVLNAVLYLERGLFAGEKASRTLLLAKTIILISFTLIVMNLFIPILYSFDSSNFYFRLNGYYALGAVDIAATVLALISVVRKREALSQVEYICLVVSIITPLVAALIQLFVYGISILIIIVGATQFLLFLISYINAFSSLSEKEAEVEDYNARLILSQLQPHFMLNALSTIQYLCRTAPDDAAETIADLNAYIRDNMEFSRSSNLIPFERELGHVEKYIAIEQKRFGERIKLELDIREEEFMIPPLSVQPLVENAVKHGISKKRTGGTVTVSTWKNEDSICIRVRDDGKGFDPEMVPDDKRPHIGMKIVRERIEKQIRGQMKVESVLGEGTTVELTIPIEIQ